MAKELTRRSFDTDTYGSRGILSIGIFETNNGFLVEGPAFNGKKCLPEFMDHSFCFPDRFDEANVLDAVLELVRSKLKMILEVKKNEKIAAQKEECARETQGELTFFDTNKIEQDKLKFYTDAKPGTGQMGKYE